MPGNSQSINKPATLAYAAVSIFIYIGLSLSSPGEKNANLSALKRPSRLCLILHPSLFLDGIVKLTLSLIQHRNNVIVPSFCFARTLSRAGALAPSASAHTHAGIYRVSSGPRERGRGRKEERENRGSAETQGVIRAAATAAAGTSYFTWPLSASFFSLSCLFLLLSCAFARVLFLPPARTYKSP